MTTPPAWEDRIVAYEAGVDPEQLLAHPLNARRHPGPQREALRESVGNIGWVAPVVANQQTGHLLDGHARVEEAITAGETVPVVYVDLTEDEERFVLATLDPISAMATYDFETVDLLLEGLEGESAAMQELLAGLGSSDSGFNDRPFGGSPNAEPEETDLNDHLDAATNMCPKCSFRW